jgi:hypothetical protein
MADKGRMVRAKESAAMTSESRFVNTRPKLVIGVILLLILALDLGGLYYYHHKSRQHCISFYGKDGVQLLYQDCQ